MHVMPSLVESGTVFIDDWYIQCCCCDLMVLPQLIFAVQVPLVTADHLIRSISNSSMRVSSP